MPIPPHPASNLHQRSARRTTSRDRALARHLHDFFEFDMELAKVEGIHFYAQHGVVTLYGTIGHGLDEEMLVNLVEDLPGVENVVSNLKVLGD